jgi:hypothetical protein
MHIVTAAHDRSIRLWERTEEPLILDEEKEQVISINIETSPTITRATLTHTLRGSVVSS